MIEEVKAILEENYNCPPDIEDLVCESKNEFEDRVARQIDDLYNKSKPPPIPNGAIAEIKRQNDEEYLVGYWKSKPKPDKDRLLSKDSLLSDEEELVEWVAKLVNNVPKDGYNYGNDVARQILSHMVDNRWVQLDPDQSLPSESYLHGRRKATVEDLRDYGWRKVKETR